MRIDLKEMNAIDRIFTKGRINLLKVGFVGSNMSHGEQASSKIKIFWRIRYNYNRPSLYFWYFTGNNIDGVKSNITKYEL